MTTTMTPAISHTIDRNYSIKRSSVFVRLLTWCAQEEKNRLLWTGIMLTLHGCVLTPSTVLIVALTGVNFLSITAASFAMTFVLIANLAALPTKYTLPVFFLSIIVDMVVILAAVSF